MWSFVCNLLDMFSCGFSRCSASKKSPSGVLKRRVQKVATRNHYPGYFCVYRASPNEMKCSLQSLLQLDEDTTDFFKKTVTSSMWKSSFWSQSVSNSHPFPSLLSIGSICLFAERQREEARKQQKLGKFGKNPAVETSFLPDRYDR